LAKCQKARNSAAFHKAALSPKVFLKMSAYGYSSWTVPHKMFSKLRGAMNGGCGMVVFMDTISMGWLSAFEPASKGRFMIEVKTELSRPQRLRTFNATAQA
jgi:hypothetical protein